MTRQLVLAAREYVEDHVKQLEPKCPLSSDGILQYMTQNENMDKDEVVRIITDLFLAAADTV